MPQGISTRHQLLQKVDETKSNIKKGSKLTISLLRQTRSLRAEVQRVVANLAIASRSVGNSEADLEWAHALAESGIPDEVAIRIWSLKDEKSRTNKELDNQQ